MKDMIHNEWSMINSFDSIRPRIDAERQNLVTRKLKRAAENLAEEGKRKIYRCTEDFFADAEDLLMRYLPDFDSRDFVKSIKNKVQMDLEENDLFSNVSETEEPEYGFMDGVQDFLAGISLGGAALPIVLFKGHEKK